MFLVIVPLGLLLGIFLFRPRRGKSILHDLRGPPSKSFWLGTVSRFKYGTHHLSMLYR
jgi:hypothetical protein